MTRLHLFAGEKYWPGWINVDAHSETDIEADCRRLPFESDYADEVQAIHGLEHVPRLEVENMLMDWHRVMKPGARLVIEVPCLDKIAAHIVAGERNIRLTVLGIFGDPRDQKPGMLHAWAYTKAEISSVLEQCGFAEVKIMEAAFHVPARDMRIEAVKP